METQADWLRSVASADRDDCVLWPFSQGWHGYGRVYCDGRHQRAHRLALTMATGINPEGMDAAHGPCHQKLCCNPRHLSWKSRADNHADKNRDGTSQIGERNGRHKLVASEVLEARRLHQTGVSHAALGEKFGVSKSAMAQALRGDTWSWLSSPEDWGYVISGEEAEVTS